MILRMRAIDIFQAFGLIWALFGKAIITRVIPIHVHTLGIQTQNCNQGPVLSLIRAAVSLSVDFAFQWGPRLVFTSGVLIVLPWRLSPSCFSPISWAVRAWGPSSGGDRPSPARKGFA